jgi:hypothetical protein
MIQADYRGARGANAGDDFHELWALRQALMLLDQDAALTAVTVEGLRAEDESGTPRDTWDGVDCTLYYGGDHAASAERIVIAQLKYSAANPDQAWTVARLTQNSNKRQDNSVIGRLAKAFAGLKGKRSDLVESGNLVVRLVSNQRVDPAVVNALSGQSTSEDSSNRQVALPSSPQAVCRMRTSKPSQGPSISLTVGADRALLLRSVYSRPSPNGPTMTRALLSTTSCGSCGVP